jgi:two-component system response regulator HydG
VLEDRCAGRGDAACHLIGRTREDWGDERAEELRFFAAEHLKECLDVSLQRVMETLKAAERKLRDTTGRWSASPATEAPLGIVATARAMRQLVDLARRVAKVDSTVLITGESGSGKERIARLVHDESTRAAGPFIAVNCGAITETLLESELFGTRAARSPARRRTGPGLFEAANRGTLLLDEVGEVSPGMQVKLLRALQERRSGASARTSSRRVDVRVLAATNRNLATPSPSGAFRQDLYYRLKVVELHVPPLRERPDDILPLARVLLADAALRMKRKITGMPPRAPTS